MIYKWKTTSRIDVDPQPVGEELERIRVVHNGRLDARSVVDAARDEASPLHAVFEWDDLRAAELWRVEQAGYLIRHLVVEVEKAGEAEEVRAFVSVVRDEDRSYTSVAHAMADPLLRQQVLANALRELEAWRSRHAELVELAKIFAAIDEARTA